MNDYIERKRHLDIVDSNLKMVFDRTNASKAEQVLIRNFAKMLRRGYKDITVSVKHGGEEHRFEAHWLVRLIVEAPNISIPDQEKKDG